MLDCWLNGQPIKKILATERGFSYGDGLFSTIAVCQGQAKLLNLHWQRLEQGCQRLLIDCQHLAQWQQDFQRFISAYPNCTAKIIVTRGEGVEVICLTLISRLIVIFMLMQEVLTLNIINKVFKAIFYSSV